MTAAKIEILQDLDVGQRVAELETEHLASYFVETDQWRRIYAGEIDVVYGPKGSGKSAIYTVLFARRDELFDRHVLVERAENPTGNPAFEDLADDPPASEAEFIGLWKLYIASLCATVIEDYGITNDPARDLLDILSESGLIPPPDTLSARVKRVLEYVRRMLRPQSLETQVTLDPVTGIPAGFGGKIVFGEPSAEAVRAGIRSVDHVLRLANKALETSGYTLWLLFDRLDVAFIGSADLETNALRALFKTYLDLVPLSNIVPKVFLRTDIWQAITSEGFREASHITRTLTLSWDRTALLILVLRRLLPSDAFTQYYDLNPESVFSDVNEQEELLGRVFPDQVDSGRNPATFDWMRGRVADATGSAAPRELIHLLTEARNEQIRLIEAGNVEPPEEQLFERQALRDALPPVSRVRLEQTLYAEYPDLKPYLEMLRGEKTTQTPETLTQIWSVEPEQARSLASRLIEIGFFESRGTRDAPSYRVPFLYRSGLDMVQGTATLE